MADPSTSPYINHQFSKMICTLSCEKQCRPLCNKYLRNGLAIIQQAKTRSQRIPKGFLNQISSCENATPRLVDRRQICDRKVVLYHTILQHLGVSNTIGKHFLSYTVMIHADVP